MSVSGKKDGIQNRNEVISPREKPRLGGKNVQNGSLGKNNEKKKSEKY